MGVLQRLRSTGTKVFRWVLAARVSATDATYKHYGHVGSSWKSMLSQILMFCLMDNKVLHVMGPWLAQVLLNSSLSMNGPQRTACLAKGYNNDKCK